MDTAPTLKLRAGDAENLQIISAVLQDSLVPVCDMIFQAEAQSFVLVAQRLRRERGGDTDRICCALTINGVTGVQTQGIDLRSADRILDLLALLVEGNTLSLIFAGGAKIRLDLATWAVLVEDFGEAWPALCSPCHDQTGV